MTKTHETYINELRERNPGIECLGTYNGAAVKILHRCRKCGHEWMVRPYTLVCKSPRGCPHCAAVKAGKANQSYTTETFAGALSDVHPEMELVGSYPGSHAKATFRCIRCGYEWKAMPYSVLQGHGCPRCAKSGTSFMEQVLFGALRLALGDGTVLHRDKSAIGEELDIFIPSLGVAIEPGSWALHEKRLWKDRQKSELCSRAGIRLIVIYDKFPDEATLPFAIDCLTFRGDFNKDDHKHLWSAVANLLELSGIQYEYSADEIEKIEAEAYERSKSMTHEGFVARMLEVNPTIEILGKYVNSNRRIKCKCMVCGREWEAVPSALLAGDGCWDCARVAIGESQRLAPDVFIEKLRTIDPKIEIDLSTYKGSHARVKAKCLRCGNEWEPVARTLIRKNPCGCPECRKRDRQAKLDAEYKAELQRTKPYITCLESYETRSMKLLHRCEICGYVWKTNPASMLNSVHGCPHWAEHPST